MKTTFLAVVALVSCVFAEEWSPKNQDQVKAIHIECTRKYDLTHEQYIQVRTIQLTDDEKIRSYFRCVAVKIGVYSTGHGYYADRLAKQFKKDLDEDQVKSWAEDCIAKHYKPDKQGDKGDLQVRNCFLTSIAGEQIKSEALQHLEASQLQNKTLNY